MRSLERFELLRERGASVTEALRVASELGLGEIEKIRILRVVFGLSFKEAKTIRLQESGVADSVEEHEASIAAALLRASDSELEALFSQPGEDAISEDGED